MTGDGAGYDDGVGFHADMARMYNEGWAIEVVSWLRPCRQALRDWATTHGCFVALDDYYESVTFLEGGRRSIPLDLSSRSISTPRLNSAQRVEVRVQKEKDAEILTLQEKVTALEETIAAKARRKAKYERRMARGRRSD